MALKRSFCDHHLRSWFHKVFFLVRVFLSSPSLFLSISLSEFLSFSFLSGSFGRFRSLSVVLAETNRETRKRRFETAVIREINSQFSFWSAQGMSRSLRVSLTSHILAHFHMRRLFRPNPHLFFVDRIRFYEIFGNWMDFRCRSKTSPRRGDEARDSSSADCTVHTCQRNQRLVGGGERKSQTH